MWLLERLIKEPFTISVQGCPFVIHFDNETERKAIFNNYDLAELAFLKDATSKPGSVFVDVGANCGYYTHTIAAAMKPGSQVLALEPNPEMCRRTTVNRQNALSAGLATEIPVILEQCAVGERGETGYLKMPVGENSYGGAHISSDADGIRVDIRSLEDILNQHGITSVAALKIDIEGHEDKALRPFIETAPRSLFPKAIVMEHTSGGHWDCDILKLLKEAGYREVNRTRANAMLSLAS
jgi:FkbM family methyltransferase